MRTISIPDPVPAHFPAAATDDGFTVTLPPVLVLQNRQQLRHVVDELLDQPGLVIRLDCAELVYVDSSGLGVLVSLNKAAKRLGKRMILANFVSDDMRALFAMTKIGPLFTVEPPLDE